MDAKKLNEERKKQKLSVAELAERANLPKGTVEKVLFGIVEHPRVDTMQAIERALGIGGQTLEWTDEDRALGVGNHPVNLSADEWEWLELGSEVLRLKGKDYLDMLKRMIQAAIEIK